MDWQLLSFGVGAMLLGAGVTILLLNVFGMLKDDTPPHMRVSKHTPASRLADLAARLGQEAKLFHDKLDRIEERLNDRR